MMKTVLSVILFLLFINSISGLIAGRLDSYEDVGYVIPKKTFQVGENAYFKTYFDIFNETLTDIVARKFSVNLWNGSNILFFENGFYVPPADEVNLIVGDGVNDNQVNIVLRLIPDVFPVVDGTQQYASFSLLLDLVHPSGPNTEYTVNSLVSIQNHYTPPTITGSSSSQPSTTGSQSTTASNTNNSPIMTISIPILLLILSIILF